MSAELDRLWRLSFARISARAAELMVEHEGRSVNVCIQQAMAEEIFLYGVPSANPEPTTGLVGYSPIQRVQP